MQQSSCLSLMDYEARFLQTLDARMRAYLSAPAGRGRTHQRNLKAFDQYCILPKILADIGGGSTQTHLLGRQFKHPIFVAPMALQKLAHPDGERATALGSAAQEAPMIVSCQSSQPLEALTDIIAPRWFQIYMQPERTMTLALLDMAHAHHMEALVVTIDAPISGLRYEEQRLGFALPEGVRPVLLDQLPRPEPILLDENGSPVFDGIMARAPKWDDIAWLRSQTDLPILLKGILNIDDAKRAVAIGINGVIVSNHGGRIFDALPASLDILPKMRKALGDGAVILFDSGIRSGEDIFKAIALGANAVLIGQPVLWGLAVNGAHGVSHVLSILRHELEITMALSGCQNFTQISRSELFS